MATADCKMTKSGDVTLMDSKAREKRLLELFRVAWNGAIGAALHRKQDEDRCLHALSRLKFFPVSKDILGSTNVAISIYNLQTHSSNRIQCLSREVITAWKKKVHDLVLRTSFTPMKPGDDSSKAGNRVTVPLNRVKIQSMKRDKLQEQILEGLRMVLKEDSSAYAYDAARVASSLESELFLKWGAPADGNRNKYRSLLFNLKNPKNPDFRRNILYGKINARRVSDMNALEMASDAMKQDVKCIQAKALEKCTVQQKQYDPSLHQLQRQVY